MREDKDKDKGKEENIMKREVGRKRSNQKVSQIAISQVKMINTCRRYETALNFGILKKIMILV